VHWCTTQGLRARPLDLLGYGDEDEEALPSTSAADTAETASTGEA
jgi:putative mRNA 3-end processing factor